jgi:hypothetical protein
MRVVTLYYQSGQFLGVGDCEIFFRVRVGDDQAWGSKMPSFGSGISVPNAQTPILFANNSTASLPRIAIITAKTRDRVAQVACAVIIHHHTRLHAPPPLSQHRHRHRVLCHMLLRLPIVCAAAARPRPPPLRSDARRMKRLGRRLRERDTALAR